MLGGKSESLQDEIDKFAEYQAQVIERRVNAEQGRERLKQMGRLMNVLTGGYMSQGSDPDFGAHTVLLVINLIDKRYAAYQGDFNKNIKPFIMEYLKLIVELTIEDINYRDSILGKLNEPYIRGQQVYDIFQQVDKLKQIYDKPCSEILGTATSAQLSETANQDLEERLKNYIKKEKIGKPQDTLNYLAGKWYTSKSRSNRVAMLKEGYELNDAKAKAENDVQGIEAEQEQRQFTVKQLRAINHIYEQELGNSEPAPISRLTQAAGKVLDVKNLAKVMGNPDRAFNTRPGATDTERAVAYSLDVHIGNVENYKSEIKSTVSIKADDVKAQSKFWKGLTKLFENIKKPFMELAKKLEETAKNVSNKVEEIRERPKRH